MASRALLPMRAEFGERGRQVPVQRRLGEHDVEQVIAVQQQVR